MHSSSGTKIIIKGKQIEEINIDDVLQGNVDYDDLEKAQIMQVNKERAHRSRLRRAHFRKACHLVRAFREAELALLDKWKEEQLQKDTELLLQMQTKHEQEHKCAFEAALKEKQVFQVIQPDKEIWAEEKFAERKTKFEKESKEQKKRLLEMMKHEKLERAKERREQYLKKLKVEMEKKRKEEEEKKILQQLERKRADEETRERKLQEQVEKQRKREMEIEEKQRQQTAPSAGRVRGDDEREGWRKEGASPPSRGNDLKPDKNEEKWREEDRKKESNQEKEETDKPDEEGFTTVATKKGRR